MAPLKLYDAVKSMSKEELRKMAKEVYDLKKQYSPQSKHRSLELQRLLKLSWHEDFIDRLIAVNEELCHEVLRRFREDLI